MIHYCDNNKTSASIIQPKNASLVSACVLNCLESIYFEKKEKRLRPKLVNLWAKDRGIFCKVVGHGPHNKDPKFFFLLFAIVLEALLRKDQLVMLTIAKCIETSKWQGYNKSFEYWGFILCEREGQEKGYNDKLFTKLNRRSTYCSKVSASLFALATRFWWSQ